MEGEGKLDRLVGCDNGCDEYENLRHLGRGRGREKGERVRESKCAWERRGRSERKREEREKAV